MHSGIAIQYYRSRTLASNQCFGHCDKIHSSFTVCFAQVRKFLTLTIPTLADVDFNILRILSRLYCFAKNLRILLDYSTHLKLNSTRSCLWAIVFLDLCQLKAKSIQILVKLQSSETGDVDAMKFKEMINCISAYSIRIQGKWNQREMPNYCLVSQPSPAELLGRHNGSTHSQCSFGFAFPQSMPQYLWRISNQIVFKKMCTSPICLNLKLFNNRVEVAEKSILKTLFVEVLSVISNNLWNFVNS